MLQPGGQAPGAVGGGSTGSGWGGSVKERGSAKEFVSGGWVGTGVCNEPGGGRSGRDRLDVGAWLKGEAIKGNGLGGV